jgi:LemA protein
MADVLLALVAPLLPALWLARAYNDLVARRDRVRNAWRQIDVQLARRHDLIPNLVAAVKGAMQFERETLEALVAARAGAVTAAQAAGGPGGVQESAAAEARLSAALGRFVTHVEAHPELRSLQSVAALQEELRSTENRVAFARQLYNDEVARYNTRRRALPGALVAALAGAEPADPWQAPEGAERVPVVDLTLAAATGSGPRSGGGAPA